MLAPRLAAPLIAAIVTGFDAGLDMAAVAFYASLAVALLPLLTVAASVVVLVWHGLRGSDPGPAARMLITLVRLVLPRSPRG